MLWLEAAVAPSDVPVARQCRRHDGNGKELHNAVTRFIATAAAFNNTLPDNCATILP